MTFTPVHVEQLRHVWLRLGTFRIHNLLLMTKVLLEIDTKALVQSLITILIVEENLSKLRETLYVKLHPTAITIGIALSLNFSHLFNLVDFKYTDRVARYAGLNVNFIVDGLVTIFAPSLLLNNVRSDVSELLVLS